MSTTTQILFNSPALHSLKRDQLVKLCKIHTLRASGKNKELIERLQLHAKTLPLDDPLSIAVRSENLDARPAPDSEDEASNHSAEIHASMSNNTRPSEQWDVVMDTIAEVDEESLRSRRGATDRQVGEFGANTSKVSVTSSLRAIANSLGLRRNAQKTAEPSSESSSSSLSSKEAVQSSSTLPTSDPNGGPEEPPVAPVPGQSNLRGSPAPAGGRLSLSQAPATTTIRLVSNPAANPELLLSPPKLKPFTTSFDLVPGTPGGIGTSSVPVWPMSPGGAARESLYPAIPIEEFGDMNKLQSPRFTRYDTSDMDIDVDIPGGLAVPSIREPTPARSNANARFNTGATPKSTERPRAEPVDIFSPAPKPQNASTRDRTRLGIPRSEPFVFGSPFPQNNMSNRQFRTAAQSVLDEMNKRLAEEGIEAVNANVLTNRPTSTEEPMEKQDGSSRVRVGDMFDEAHQREFDKMDSITSHYAAKRGAQNTSAQPILSKKRKSSLVVKERQSGVPASRHRLNGSRVVSGASIKTLPGDFGEEGEEEDESDRRVSKRPRVDREESDVPAEPEKTPFIPPSNPEEEARKQKEREAIRRRLEHNKAKRRSSMGRPSLGRAPAPKPTRFGFLTTAKSLVQNVWNRGAGSKAPSSIPVTKPAQPKVETKVLSKTIDAKKKSVIPGSSGGPPVGSQTMHVASGGSQSSATGRSTLKLSSESGGTATSSRLRKPSTPSSNQPSAFAAANPRSLTIAGYGQSNNRGDSLAGFTSLGTKSALSIHNNGGASSLGAKSKIKASAGNLQKPTTSTIPRSRTSSTLMAPTASSLAKTTIQSHARMPVSGASYTENGTVGRAGMGAKQRFAMSPPPSAASTLGAITNSPPSPPTKIFSQSLSPPLARPPMSLTAAATYIVTASGRSTQNSPMKVSGDVKPKVLAGRRPRISRSKVIARLASQRAAGTSSGLGAEGGKVRSSTGAEAAGKGRQSYGGAKGGDVLMSAKKRVRQSEHMRRQSRAMASPRMDTD